MMSEDEQDFIPIIQHYAWKLPDPWEVCIIKPELYFYIQGEDPITIPYTDDPEKTIAELQSAGFLKLGYFRTYTSSIIFITHGFENDVETAWLPKMKDEILTTNPNALVVLVGWGGGANIGILKYSQAAANTQTVGAWLSDYVKEFRKLTNSVQIWGIGHSLGAHLLGIAGRMSEGFDRITGLDPAGPSFEKVNQENRLRKTDAKIVDVIHTDGYDTVFDPSDWFAPVNHYGTLIPLGTVDFYPNFGYRQPGIGHFEIAGSHHRSIELFIWSISNSGKFATNSVIDGVPQFESPVTKVKPAVEIAEMGFHYNCKTDGLFYIETKGSIPWKEPGEEKANGSGDNNGWISCVIS